MRATTAAELALLAQYGSNNHLRVWIDRGGGDWVNLTSLEGRNWVKGAEWNEDTDNEVRDATVHLARADAYLSLSTFMDASKLNQLGTIVDIGNPIYIETATTPEGVLPQTGDWKEMFRGQIEDVDWTATPIVVKCLDDGAALQSAWIETQQKYPADPATSANVEDIMQAILNDYGGSVVLWSVNGTVGTEFNPADSPGWVVTEYNQKKQPVMEALKTLANAIGWDVRYRWNASAGAFVLTFGEPDRAKTTPDLTLTKSKYTKVNTCKLSRAGIRDAITVTYKDATLGHTSVTRTNAASIAKYGRRFMEICEAASSQIDTATEATALADACLADLCEPNMEKTVTLPYMWPAELGDLISFTANGVHYDADQSLAVVSIKQSLMNGKATTELGCRGKPSGGFKRWLSLEARAGIAPSSDLLPKDAPTGGTGTPGIGSITVVYDDPRGMSPPVTDWAYTECHLGSSGTFTPDTSTLRATGKQTRFDIVGLDPGVTYYVKLIIIDGSGNIGATSTAIQVATEKVGAYHTNNDTILGNLVPNGDFGQATKDIATVPPDAWSIENASYPYTAEWSSGGDVWHDETIQETGFRSIKFPSGGDADARIISDYIPVTVDTLYEMAFAVRASSIAAGKNVGLGYLTYDKDKAYIGSSLQKDSVLAAANVFELYRYRDYWAGTGASTVRFIRLYANHRATGFDMWVDRILFARARQQFSAYRANAKAIANTTQTGAITDTELFDIGGFTTGGVVYGYNPGTGLFRCYEAGDYLFEAAIGFASITAGNTAEIGWRLNGAQSRIGQSVAVGGTTAAHLAAAPYRVALIRGDTVEPYAYHNNGAGVSVVTGSVNTYFTGQRVAP